MIAHRRVLPRPRAVAGAALEARDLAVSGPGGHRLLGPVSFDVAAGERVAIIGSSGAGKSLLAAAVAGALPPGMLGSGDVLCRGAAGAGDAVARVASVAQDSTTVLNPLVRIGTQLARPLRAGGLAPRLRRLEVERLLAATGLEDPASLVDRFPAELSGGQRQRVCIALALACRADLVIADEPTTALDVVTEQEVLALLAAVPATLLLITHDLAAAARWCERVLVLDAGQVVEDAPVDRLFAEPRHPRTRALVRHAVRARAGAR